MLFRFNRRGNIMISFLIAAILGTIVSAIMGITVSLKKQAVTQRQSVQMRMYTQSAMEAFLYVLKFSEFNYALEVRACDSANSFLVALSKGHACSSRGSFSAFKASDITYLNATEQSRFTFTSGFTVNRNSPTSTGKIVTILIDDGVRADISYVGTFLNKNKARFKIKLTLPSSAEFETYSEVYLSDAPNRVHLDSDFKLRAETPSAADPCDNVAWEEFLSFIGSSCVKPATYGGALGLAYYRENYFALRPQDGQIVLYNDLSSNPLIPETGIFGGDKIFPSYNRLSLADVDDIEVVGEDQGRDQIYGVMSRGLDAKIAYIDSLGNETNVCKLGEIGWAQSFTGIMNSSRGQTLVDTRSTFSASIGSFTLKSDTGDLLRVYILASKKKPTIESTYIQTVGSIHYTCVAFKESSTPLTEYSRTFGITRGSNSSKSYIVY